MTFLNFARELAGITDVAYEDYAVCVSGDDVCIGHNNRDALDRLMRGIKKLYAEEHGKKHGLGMVATSLGIYDRPDFLSKLGLKERSILIRTPDKVIATAIAPELLKMTPNEAHAAAFYVLTYIADNPLIKAIAEWRRRLAGIVLK